MTHEPGRITAIATDLGAARGRIEASFVAVGDWLTQSATLLNRIAHAFEALPQDLASPELTEATTRLSAVGRRAGEISASFAAERSAIDELDAVVVAAEHPISDLRRTVKMMGIVAVNARVVAAGIVGNDHDFDVFTTDIAQLSEGVSRTIEDFSDSYRKLTAQVRRAVAQRAQFEAAHRDTLSRLAERLQHNLDELVARRRLSAESSVETSRVSREIAARIASAVISKQVGDSTRQRLEHAESSLAVIAGLCDGVLPDGVSLPADDSPHAVADALALQAAQLGGASETFNAEIAEAGGALRALSGDARTVMDKSTAVYGDGRSGQSSLAAFNAEIRAAIAVLRDCESERKKLEQVAVAVEDIVRVLLGHVEAVREVESDMRLVSLNAAVRCAQLGPRGRALNVIALQLRELTGETVLAAESAMQCLERAAALAQSFSASSGSESVEEVAWLEQEAASSAELLGAVDGRLAEALTLLGTDGPAAIRHLGEAADRLAAHEEMSEAIEDAALRVAELAGPAADAPTPASRELLAHLRRVYTMDAERRIHDAFAGASAPAQAGDVELFA
jgi:hypothetical protein